MIGRTVSHYRITEKLGEGGMGVVYRAEDTRLHRAVAIKFLRPDLLAGEERETARERFLREARAAARLDHPNICTVYDVGESEEGTFLVMAFCDGVTLRERTRSGPLPIDEVVDIGMRVARGLEEAHRQGILHRDIKTANLMTTSAGDVRITDFGLAKLAEGTTITKTGGALGTAAYMAPEQLRGEPSDERADLWSLGVVLYEMATGELPFRADHEPALHYAIMNSDPPPPGEIRPAVPDELARIIDRALQKDPSKRYTDAAEMRRDLERLRLQDQISTSEVTAGGGEAAVSGHRRRLLPFALLGIAVVAASIFLWGRGGSDRPAPEGQARKKIVVLPFENLGDPDDAYFAAGMTEEITSRLAAVRELGVISRTSAVQYDPTGKTMGEIGEDLGVHYVLEGTVRWAKTPGGASRVRVTPQLIRVADDTHLWSEPYDGDLEDVFALQSEIAGQIIERLDVTILEPERRAIEEIPTENLVAYQAYLRGMEALGHELGEEDLEAVTLFEQAVDLDPEFTLAWVGLARAHRSLYFNGFDKTDARRAKAETAVRKAVDLQPESPEVRIELGYYFYNCRLDYDRALEEFAVASRSLPKDPRILAAIAYIWRRQGLLKESIPPLEKAFELDPRRSDIALNIGLSYMLIREYAEADRWYDRSLALESSESHAHIFRWLNRLTWDGDLEAARAILRKAPYADDPLTSQIWAYQAILERDYPAALEALALYPEKVMLNQEMYIPVTLWRGRVLFEMGEEARGRDAIDSARVLLEAAVAEMPEDNRVHGSLAIANAYLGRKEEAIREARLAVELASGDAFRLSDRQWDLIVVLVRVGEVEEALVEIERGLTMPGRISVSWLRLDPTIDPIRDDPRFQELLERYSK